VAPRSRQEPEEAGQAVLPGATACSKAACLWVTHLPSCLVPLGQICL
jgi:hypothetical protein